MVHAGLEVISASGAKELEWRNWEPGGSYPKKIIVRNISKKTLKFKYKIPGTKYFMMPFPEPTVLCAGMTKIVDITFRPVKKEQYVDEVEFRTGDGVLSVPIRATLKEIRLEVPSTLLDFGYCPVNETQTLMFVVKNTGELDAPFLWDSKAPFSFEPSSGVIKPGKSINVAANYHPTSAKAISSTAVMVVGDNGLLRYPKEMKGISKFAHVTTSSGSLDFGPVFVGRSFEKTVELSNSTAVHTSFKIKRLEKTFDQSFTFNPKQGTIPAGGSITLRVRYSALSADYESADTFQLTTPGGNTVTVHCRARCFGPSVRLSSTSVNFGQVKLGSSSMRVITVYNTSDTSAQVHFHAQPDGAFSFNRTDLLLTPRSSQHVNLYFSPGHPVNYFHRVEMMILHAAPQHVDLLGNGYTHEARPAPLWQRHVVRQRRRQARGLSKYPPELMEGILMEKGLWEADQDLDRQEDMDLKVETKHAQRTEAQDRARIISLAEKEAELDAKASVEGMGTHRPTTGVGETALDRLNRRDEKEFAEWHEVFHAETADDRDVCLSTSHLDLGTASPHKAVDPGTVLLHNRTMGKISCTWIVPHDSSGSAGSDVPVFQVIPAAVDVPPKSTYQFKVMFNPAADNQAYGAVLQCLVNFKTMRNFRLVNEKTLSVPWCLPLSLCGSSTQDDERFTPDVEIDPLRIQFYPCHVGAEAFQNFRMHNTGDTVVSYKITAPEPFAVHQSNGIIRAHSSAIVGVRFCPKDTMPWARTLRCVFNNNVDTAQDIQVVGRGARTTLEILGKGPTKSDLFFPHTCVGSTVTQSLGINNPTRLPIRFMWHVPKRLERVFSPSPAHGVLRPYQAMAMEWTFAPAVEKELSFAVPCTFRAARNVDSTAEALDQRSLVASSGRAESSLEMLGSPEEGMEVLKITAVGVEGALLLAPLAVDLGVVTVWTSTRRTVTLRNMTNGRVTYLVTAACPENDRERSVDISIDTPFGVLAPRNSAPIQLTITPRRPFRESDSLACNVHCFVLSEEEVKKQKETIMEQRAKKIARSKTEKSRMTAAQQSALFEKPLTFHAPEGMRTLSVCHIHGHADHPFVIVKDVRSDGVPTSRQWTQCSIPQLNTHLTKPTLSPFEALLGNESKTRRKTEQNREVLALRKELPVFPINLSSGEAGEDETCIDLQVFNSGLIPASFQFVTPKGLEPVLEHWADTGLSTGDDLHQEFIEEHQIFQIEPHKGTLPPNGSCRIRIRYSHRFVGSHSITILFGVKLGHQAMLQLTGQTLPPRTRRLEIGPGTTLCPVAIGVQKPMVQTLELRNPGTQDVYFDVDTTPLQLLARDNYDIPIIECISPSGMIRAGASEWLEFIFRPIEVKEYSVGLPLYVRDEDGTPFPLVFPTPRETSAYQRACVVMNEGNGNQSVDVPMSSANGSDAIVPVISLRGVGYNPLVAKLPLPGGQTRFGAISRLSLNGSPLPIESGPRPTADTGDQETFIAHVMTARRVAMHPIEQSIPPPSGNENLLGQGKTPSQGQGEGDDDQAESEFAREHLIQSVSASLDWPPPTHQTLGVIYGTGVETPTVTISDPDVGCGRAAPAVLSVERLDFGVIPTHTKAARLVTVRNVSTTDVLSFKWGASRGACGGNLTVYPSTGRLHPGTHTLCRVSLEAGTRTAMWSFNAECVFTNETKRQMSEAVSQAEREAAITADEEFAADGHSPGHIPPRPSARPRPARKTVADRASTIARDRARSAREATIQAQQHAETLPAGVTLGLGWTAAMRSEEAQASNHPQFAATPKFNDPAATNRGFALPGSPDPHASLQKPKHTDYRGVLYLLVEAMVDDVKTFDRASEEMMEPGLSLAMTPAPGEVAELGPARGSPVPHSPRVPVHRASANPPAGQRHSLNDFFIPLATPSTVPGRQTGSGPSRALPPQHKAILETVMEDIVRDLSKDRSTAEVYEAMFHEPVPFYEQLTESEKQPIPSNDRPEHVLKDPFFTQVAEEILENTLLNLMSEASHREFNLVVPPKFFVKKEGE